jgi:FkbM family methyltransferase
VALKHSQKEGYQQAVDDFFLDPRFEELLGAQKFLLVDGGAKGGVQGEWVPVIPLLEVLAFEPLWPADRDELVATLDIGDSSKLEVPKDRRKIKPFPTATALFPMALANDCGTRTLRVTRGPSMSSFLVADSERWDLYGLKRDTELRRTVEVETTTIDTIIEERGIRFVDFVKLDTQGSELEILAGGARTIGELAFGVRVEASFVPLYEDQPYFSDIDLLMRGHGFEFIDFVHMKRLHRPGAEGDVPEAAKTNKGYGQVVQADPLYFRTPSAVAARMGELNGRDRERYLVGATIACLIYARVDYAWGLLRLARPLIDSRTADVVEELLRVYPGSS